MSLPTKPGYYLADEDEPWGDPNMGLLLLSTNGGWFHLHSPASIEGGEESEGVYRSLTSDQVSSMEPLYPLARGEFPPPPGRFEVGQHLRPKSRRTADLVGLPFEARFRVLESHQQDWSRFGRPSFVPEGSSNTYYLVVRTDPDAVSGETFSIYDFAFELDT